MMPETLSVGTSVYVPTIKTTDIMLECPDCRGEHKWIVSTPSGHSHTIDCPRCKGGDRRYEFLRPKRRERTLAILEAKICEVTVHQRADDKTGEVKVSVTYRTAPYLGHYSAERVFSVLDDAEKAGRAMIEADVNREKAEWEKEDKHAEARAGLHIMAALQARADEKRKSLDEKIEALRDKMLEAIKYPSLYGPSITRRSFGADELTPAALAEWLDTMLTDAGLDGWSESEIHEATCHC